ncbi:MAG TPA: hypothetical protein DCL44_06270 [Elusimicrobia bacterium]|nr:hypothetical protein [Elusimicrobiota bacterium]
MKALIFETSPLDAYEQMAADETLCESLPSDYIVRFYNWKGSGVTFGYSQRHKAVLAAIAAGGKYPQAVVRRPTGGGIVIHETDLTFSFIFPSHDVYFEPGKTYDRLHKAINSAYEKAGVSFSMLREKTKNYAVNDPLMDCFSTPVNMDILYNGKKVLGGALRKFGGRMLYQASLQAEDARSNAGFHKNTILKAFGSEFGLNWHAAGADDKTLKGLKNLARTKYFSTAWNERI